MDDTASIQKSSLVKTERTYDAKNSGSKNRKNSVLSSGSVNKRRCVSTACIACRRRKSKCDGNVPKCAACASVYLTECEYAPHTDHRRKGVYKKETDSLKTKSSTLQLLVQTLLTYGEEEAIDFLKQMRSSDNLENLVQVLEAKNKGLDDLQNDSPTSNSDPPELARFDVELSARMGDLMLDGSVKFIGGTSNLVWLEDSRQGSVPLQGESLVVRPCKEAILGWTTVTNDKALILHFTNMYFCWHYPYFPALAKELFYRDFLTGTDSQYCSSILVNAILALGCHFSSKSAARANPDDESTIGDHYFAEAKRLLYENEEFANAKLCTVQALAIMSVREAGCGRESKGWVYSGMSFRMALDLGLNVDVPAINEASRFSDEDIDARRLTFWNLFLIDKCWSNYLGRQPQLHLAYTSTKKYDVYPSEDSELWSPYTDSGIVNAHSQPARTRAVALQVSKLAEISADLLTSFYEPSIIEKPSTKQNELKKLSDIHTRLEAWKSELPVEFEPREGALPTILLMHMFFQLLYIHLYRPFLRFTKNTSPLPAHVSPRKYCTQAAGAISKLLRLYKRTHGLRHIINKVVYIAHSATTIHLLNLPDKNAKRDLVHGIKHLEEMGESWPAARRTLHILNLCAERWCIELPEETQETFARVTLRWASSEPTMSTEPVSPRSSVSFDLPDQNRKYAASDSQLHGMQAFPNSTQAANPAHKMQSTPHGSIASRFAVYDQPIDKNVAPVPEDITVMEGSYNPRDAWETPFPRKADAMQIPTLANGPVRSAVPTTNGQVGGVLDTFIGDSQDWWYNDQKQFAAGFENWNAPEPDWNPLNGMETSTGSSLPSLPAVGSNGLFAVQGKMPQFTQDMPTGVINALTDGIGSQNSNRFKTFNNPSRISPQQAYTAYKQANAHRQMSWGKRDLM